MLSWLNVGGATGGTVVGLLAMRYNVKFITIGVMLVSTVMVTLFGRAPAGLDVQLILICMARASSRTARSPACTRCSRRAFPTHVRAFGTGFAVGVGRGGSVLAPNLAGALFAANLGVPTVSMIMALGSLVAAGVLTMLVVKPELPESESAEKRAEVAGEPQGRRRARPLIFCERGSMIEAIENSAYAVWVRESPSIFAYTTILSLHAIGLAIIVGIHTLVALRLLGFVPAIPLATAAQAVPVDVPRVSRSTLFSGSSLLAANFSNDLGNWLFLAKLVFIALAMVNLELTRMWVFDRPGARGARRVAEALAHALRSPRSCSGAWRSSRGGSPPIRTSSKHGLASEW